MFTPTIEAIQTLMELGDPEADEVVAGIFANASVEAVNGLMRSLSGNEQAIPEALPLAVRDYFEATARLPSWAEPALLVEGERVFLRYGVQVLQALLYRGLPECYGCADEASVLVRAGRITELTHQRVVETLHFALQILTPGGLGPTGGGIRAAQRVRLLHASIRHHLLKSPHWSGPQPINQADLLFTLGTFGCCPIEVLELFGAELTASEKTAFLHVWQVTGVLLGVREDLIFGDVAGAQNAMATHRALTHRPSPAGRALTCALLDFADTLIPGHLLDGANASMMRFLCGAPLADLLGVPEDDWTRRLIQPYVHLVDGADRAQGSKVGKLIAEKMTRWFLDALLSRQFFAHRPDFALPAVLRDAWRS